MTRALRPLHLPSQLQTIEQACALLAEARSLDDVKHIHDLAETARVYAHLAKLGMEAQNHAAEIKLRAEHRAGELLAQLVGHSGGRPKNGHTQGPFSSLEDLGITKNQSSRWQTLAQLPLPELEQHISQTREREDEITTAAALRAALDYARTVEGGRMVADVVFPLPSNHRVLEGDCRELLAELPSGSAQCVVTSVPYWRQRDYGHSAQIGMEPTPEEWLETLAGVFHEVRRVVDTRASLWLNVGDKFQGSGYGWGVVSRHSGAAGRDEWHRRSLLGLATPTPGYKKLDLTLAPYRLANRLRQDGWYLRQTIVWDKAVAIEPKRPNRPSSSHEYVFLFTASAESRVMDPGETWWTESVWRIGADGSSEHPAVMPAELVRRCLIASTRTGDNVLDPFAGILTTARVARSIGRSSTSIELVHGYIASGQTHLYETPEITTEEVLP